MSDLGFNLRSHQKSIGILFDNKRVIIMSHLGFNPYLHQNQLVSCLIIKKQSSDAQS